MSGSSDEIAAESSQLPQTAPTAPARPDRLKIHFVETGDRLAFTYCHRPWSVATFLIVWLVFWTVTCIFLTRQVVQEPSREHLLLAIPFWSSWLFALCVLVKMLVGVEYFAIDASGIRFVEHVLMPVRRRQIPLEEIRQIKTCSKVVDNESGSVELGLEVQSLGRTLRFAWGLPAGERQWLQHQLNECLNALRERPLEQRKPAGSPLAAEPETQQSVTLVSREDLSWRDFRASNPTEVPPPGDCRWQRSGDLGVLCFTQRGRFHLSGFFVLLFLNAFWNGIVLIFLGSLFAANRLGKGGGLLGWAELVFLIPFGAVGLVMLLTLVATGIDPLRRTSWRFSDTSIECRVQWLGLGPVRRYELDGLARIELTPDRRDEDRGPTSVSTIQGAENATWRLIFVGRDDVELCTMPRLTEGEARWIADTVAHQRGGWFDEIGRARRVR